jgi:hypothetical protein
MDHPYQPPAAESPESAEPRKSGEAKARRAALILACAAMLVGSGLLYFFAGKGGFMDLVGERSLGEVPPLLRGILRIKPEVPIFVGMAIALFTVLFALSPLTRIALALGFLAVSIIGAWAAVLFWVLMNLLRSMAGN